MTKDTDKIVTLIDKMKKKADAPESPVPEDNTLDNFIKEGLVTFKEGITEDTTGFITVTFREDEEPSTIFAGSIDVFKTVGFLEFLKDTLLSEYACSYYDEVGE